MIGRAAKLERLGLAEQVGPAQWTMKPGLEPALRDLGIRGDIIKTMHRALSASDREPDVASFALHGDQAAEPVLGRLVERGLHDELKGTAYAIIEGVDGRTHHLVFSDLEMTGDAKPGASSRRGPTTTPSATSACRSPQDRTSRSRRRSQRLARPGSTVSFSPKTPRLGGGGFGAEVRDAMDRRIDHLVEQGMARRQGQRIIFARDLLSTLRRRELDEVTAKLSAEIGLAHRPSAEGEYVTGIYRQRVTLASGRFAMIDDGMGFSLCPGGRRWSRGWVSRCQAR